MAMTITIPDFDFSGFYYPQLLESLIQFKRRNVPELSDESEFEPLIQMLRAFALVGHLNNTLMDMLANENTLPTAKLVETVRNMLRLIDYELRPASPSQVDVVYELSKVFTAPFEIVNARAQAATKKEGANPVIFFEALTALTIDPTNVHSFVFTDESGVFTDRTAAANSPNPVDDFLPWVSAAMKDAIYWGHKQVMWDKLAVTLNGAATGITGVFEFYDGNFADSAPTSVTNIGGGQLQFNLTSIFGSTNRQGTKARVQLNETTAFQDVESTWNGTANICVTGLLGQTIPSLDAAKYTVGSDWKILQVTDGTNNLQTSGDVEFVLPQSVNNEWRQATVNNQLAFWLRYRVVIAAAPTSPTIRLTRMDTGKQFVIRSCTQGRSITENPLGSSTGLADQRFETSKDFFIDGSGTVSVDGVTWTRVKNFLNSLPADKQHSIELGKNDRATVVFGDGVNGRIPTIGVGNVAITYRFGANDDGNVGANTVTIDKTGLTFVNKLFNPRQAAGWQEAEGASESSLERAKIAGPATLRTKDVAIGPNDVVTLALAFVDASGAKPFGRALAFEEGFGPKTIELVLVAAGGALATSTQLAAIEEFFNGDQFSSPPKEKHLVANQEVVAVNYTPKPINITATVTTLAEAQNIVNRLQQILQPEAKGPDGVTPIWSFGGSVPTSRISHEIFDVDESTTKVVLSTPAADVALLPRELPTAGTINIIVLEP